ncbi:hypothetical protein ABR737_01290 [Streptomyces sp. Edi2]|uniref:hypothetical protein n=1 Tax=Streptomyces sp. Edi2 TaxID=3162528 RepID=UPI00330645A0
MTTTTFSDVVRFAADRATLDDLDLFSQAAKEGQARLDQERMDSLTEGQDIRLDRLQDRQLNDLTGKIHSINLTSRRPVAVVVIDENSLWALQGHHVYARRIPKGATSYSLTVPLACVFSR